MRPMPTILAASGALALSVLGWGATGSAQQGPAPRGELRVVDNHPANWAWITWNVFEHLMELDKDGALVPRLATSLALAR